MEIANKNIAFAGTEYGPPAFEMVEDTHFVGCNMVLARVNRNGFVLTHDRCNINGLYLDGAKQDNFVYREFAADDEAMDMLSRSGTIAGNDGTAAWLWLTENIQADQTATKAAFDVWAAEYWNTTSFEYAIEWLTGFWLVDWAGLVAKIATKTPETWRGDSTILVKELS